MATLTGKTIGELALLTGITSDTLFAVELSGATYHIPYSGLSIGGRVTYDELYSMFGNSMLIPGAYYLITDFQSIYDQPDFDKNGDPILTGTSRTGITEQLLVFATSVSTLSEKVYSLDNPYDKITYDINFNTTEVSNTPAKGRITERIDEFNNRTDYDHRNIYFKRYKLYTYRQELPQNGQIEILSGGTVTGNSTSFTLLSPKQVIYLPSFNLYYEITSITDNTTMTISGETIAETGGYYNFYLGIEETNGSNGYFSYRKNNIQVDDFIEYTTFGDALSQSYVKNTFIGDYANNYSQIGISPFILSNNVFLEGGYESNKIGNYSINNTFGTDNSNNIFGDYCINNVSTNDMDDNIIGNNFSDNIINTNLQDNIISNDFSGNFLFGENGSSFSENFIGENFRYNRIYSGFFDNKIGNGFESNLLGDYGNLSNFQFYGNVIGVNVNSNSFRQNFYNNNIGNSFYSNQINSDFYRNTIGVNFNNNRIGYEFYDNQMGTDCYNNYISEYFYRNKIGNQFYGNYISYNFNRNEISDDFNGNRAGDLSKWTWYDLNNVSGRTYNDFVSALDGAVGHIVIGKELIMWDTVSNEYHKVIFTQWTQNNNGGGFQYTRELIYPTSGPVITFTKTNYGSEVDVIVPGVLEITRGNNNQIYNIAVEPNAGGGSPQGTQWNSEYTTQLSGDNFIQNKIGNYFANNITQQRFGYNKIGNNFYNNNIASDFGYGGGNDYGNVIGENFNNNTIGEYCYNNQISNYFFSNTIGDYFQWNVINTQINSTNFITYYDTITGFTYSATGSSASDNTYNGLTGATNANGIDATFDVVVSSSAVTSVTIVQTGNYYQVNDTITILGSQIGGTDGIDDVVITITQIIEPSVYESYTCQIFERQGGDKRLSYYDSSDTLISTDVNL